MKNKRFSLVATSMALAMTTLAGCGGSSDDPKAENIPVTLESTFADIDGSAIKGTLAYAQVSVKALNGSTLTIESAEPETNAEGKAQLTVHGDAGFGIDSIVKLSVTADANSLMTCDSVACGSDSLGSTVSGNAIAGTELTTLTYLSVPYGSASDGTADATFTANVFTTFATKLIERDINDGRNVSTL